jgi:hypothetical protein
MRYKTTTLIAAAALALSLAGCAPRVAPAPEPVDPTASLEARAQDVAASMDPEFGDPATWDAAKSAARSMCNLADADPESAYEASMLVAMESGVTAEQAGIIWGIAVNVYCPEHAGLVG